VSHLDWKRRRAHVEPAEDIGRSRWRGEGQFLSRELCGSIRRILAGDGVLPHWSRRAVAQMEAIRADFPWLAEHEANVLVGSRGVPVWWTFGGGRANLAMAHELAQRTGARITSDNFAVRFPAQFALESAEDQIRRLSDVPPGQIMPQADEQALDGLKFSECLPRELAIHVVQTRLSDVEGVAAILERPVRIVYQD
jgi:ATP-dependent Lhr-like helicase